MPQHNAADPDINRKRIVSSEGKEQDAVSSLWPDTAEFLKRISRVVGRAARDQIGPSRFGSDGFCSIFDICSSVTELAAPKTILVHSSDRFCGRERMIDT
jgi:hypothetical protein